MIATNLQNHDPDVVSSFNFHIKRTFLSIGAANFVVGSGTSAVVFDIMSSWNRPFIGVNVKASSTNGRMVRYASSTTDYPVAIAMGYQDVAGFGSEDSKGGINLITVGSNISGDIDPDTYSRLYDIQS